MEDEIQPFSVQKKMESVKFKGYKVKGLKYF